MKGNGLMNALHIWPSKYLVPTMEKGLIWQRAIQIRGMELSIDNFYDATIIAMPLDDFIAHPVAYGLVHNGAASKTHGPQSQLKENLPKYRLVSMKRAWRRAHSP